MVPMRPPFPVGPEAPAQEQGLLNFQGLAGHGQSSCARMPYLWCPSGRCHLTIRWLLQTETSVKGTSTLSHA